MSGSNTPQPSWYPDFNGGNGLSPSGQARAGTAQSANPNVAQALAGLGPSMAQTSAPTSQASSPVSIDMTGGYTPGAATGPNMMGTGLGLGIGGLAGLAGSMAGPIGSIGVGALGKYAGTTVGNMVGNLMGLGSQRNFDTVAVGPQNNQLSNDLLGFNGSPTGGVSMTGGTPAGYGTSNDVATSTSGGPAGAASNASGNQGFGGTGQADPESADEQGWAKGGTVAGHHKPNHLTIVIAPPALPPMPQALGALAQMALHRHLTEEARRGVPPHVALQRVVRRLRARAQGALR